MANGIIGLVPVAQSLALAGHSASFAKKKDKDALDFLGHGVESIVGVKLLAETANVIGSF